MGLGERKRTFFQIKGSCKILVKKHAFLDYPERGFSQQEIINLIKHGSGRFTENNDSLEAIPGSYLFFPKDDLGHECKLVILIDEIEIEGEEGPIKEMIIVCSAYREV